jgi:exodeoxyribonuclease VII small subunit
LARDDSTALEFEQALAELETLVKRMEQNELTLDESLATFERGVALTRHCQASLRAAQQKVEILTKRGAQTDVEPFSGTEDAGSSALERVSEA